MQASTNPVSRAHRPQRGGSRRYQRSGAGDQNRSAFFAEISSRLWELRVVVVLPVAPAEWRGGVGRSPPCQDDLVPAFLET